MSMRKLLVCLVPWMALTAAWAQALAPASVAYTFSESSVSGALREGDECWLPLSAAPSIGWKIKSSADLADIDAEGRLIKSPTRIVSGVRYFSLSEATRQVGAVSHWREDGTYQVLGQIRSIDFIGSSVRIDSTLSFRANFSRLDSPNRLVIDLSGVAGPKEGAFKFPSGVRFGQFKTNTMRIVVDDPSVGLPRTSRPGAARHMDISLAPFRFAENVIVEPSFNAGSQPQPSRLGEADLQSATTVIPIPAVIPTVDVLNAAVREVNARSESLNLAVSAPARPQPTVAYEDSTTIVLKLAAKLQDKVNLGSLKGKFIDSVEVKKLPSNELQFRISTKRPVTFELGASGKVISLKLQQPRSSGGGLAGKTIVVDAGHGGPDSGAVGGNAKEKDLTLAVSKFLSTELTEQGASVIMTRNTDVRIPLKDRAEIANKNGAALFVSVHINSSPGTNRQSGTMSFYHMKSPDGMLLARCIQDEMIKVSGLPNLGHVSDSRIYSTGFAVLRYSEAPAVLLELAFINHSRDRAVMTQAAWQQKIAEAITRGIKAYLGDDKETQKP